MDKKGTLYFFTGLSGAGKTTIGGLFYRRLKEKNNATVLLDGDTMRDVAFKGRGHSTEARLRGAIDTLFPLCRMLTNQGIDVVCCSIALYDEVRKWNREHFENYREIYVKVSMETLYRRDQKKLYSSGAKEVVGVDLPWDEPQSPDVVIENDKEESPELIVEKLERLFEV